MNHMHVRAIPAFTDNYIWMMHDDSSAVVIDPGAAEPVENTLAGLGLKLSAIVLTHLHYDHTWGVPKLLERWPVPVYGPILNDYDRKTHPPFPKPGTVPLDCVTHPVDADDRLVLDALGTELMVMAVPGHTRGHLAYWDKAYGRVFRRQPVRRWFRSGVRFDVGHGAIAGETCQPARANKIVLRA